MPDCSARIRVASWSALISRLKKATGAPTDFSSGDAVGRSRRSGRGVEGDVGGKRGLAHARTAGKDDKVGIVQAADLFVDRISPWSCPKCGRPN
jgi:hypothetical protein